MKKIRTIYVPHMPAYLYSKLGCNPLQGKCTHGCLYCYQDKQNIRFNKFDAIIDAIPKPGYLEALEKEAKKYAGKGQILLCFNCDLYIPENIFTGYSGKILEILLRNKCAVTILTKGGTRVFQDWDIIRSFGPHISIASTLSFISTEDSLHWEPKAALPEDRLLLLKRATECGIATWASMEPCIDTDQSLELVKRSMGYVGGYKFGKLNRYKGMDQNIDYNTYTHNVVDLLRPNGVKFVIKADLLEECTDLDLTAEELDPRILDVLPFNID